MNRKMHDDISRKIPTRYSWPNIRNTRWNICNTVNPYAMCSESSRFVPRNRAPLSILYEKLGRPLENSPQKYLMLCSKCISTI